MPIGNRGEDLSYPIGGSHDYFVNESNIRGISYVIFQQNFITPNLDIVATTASKHIFNRRR